MTGSLKCALFRFTLLCWLSFTHSRTLSFSLALAFLFLQLWSDNTKNGKLKCSSSRMSHYWIIDKVSRLHSFYVCMFLEELSLSLSLFIESEWVEESTYTNAVGFSYWIQATWNWLHAFSYFILLATSEWGHEHKDKIIKIVDRNFLLERQRHTHTEEKERQKDRELNGRAINMFDMAKVVS